MLWLDKYGRQARLLPGLFALFPAAVTVVALGLQAAPIVSSIASFLSIAGGPVLLASLVRSRGLAAQQDLWGEWGGAPTLIALRLRESSTNPVQRKVWRDAIRSLTGVSLSSQAQESADPQKADQKLNTAIAQVRELTRDEDRFPLVQAENRNYGMERNLYGARKVGRSVAILGLIVAVAFMLWELSHAKRSSVEATYTIAILANAIIALGWFTVPSKKRVRVAGERYAEQLLHAAVSLASGKNGSAAASATD